MIEITIARWGAGPRWIGTLRWPGLYFEPITRWFESEIEAREWKAACEAAPPEKIWIVARGSPPRA